MPQRLNKLLVLGVTWALWLAIVAALSVPALWGVWNGYLWVTDLWPEWWWRHASIALFAGACVMVLGLAEKIASAVIPV